MSTMNNAMVLVTRDGAFSETFTKHAMHMAHEHHWDIVALHVGCALSNLMQPNKSRYCSGFMSRSERSVAPMASVAREEGVNFTHTVRFGGTESAIRDVGTDLGSVRCVLVDRQTESELRVS
jgi:hypothetical protein